MNNQNNTNYSVQSDYTRVALVDSKTSRYIGFIEGEIKLLGEYFDHEIKPFTLRSKLPYLPREGEYLELPSVKKECLVVKILHRVIISTKYPCWTLLFVNYTS